MRRVLPGGRPRLRTPRDQRREAGEINKSQPQFEALQGLSVLRLGDRLHAGFGTDARSKS